MVPRVIPISLVSIRVDYIINLHLNSVKSNIKKEINFTICLENNYFILKI